MSNDGGGTLGEGLALLILMTDIRSLLISKRVLLSIVCQGGHWYASMGSIGKSDPPVSVSDESFTELAMKVRSHLNERPKLHADV